MKKPTLYVVAGANGSGKSTLVKKYRRFSKNIVFVNPDDIAKAMDPSYDGKNNQLIVAAGREAVKRQNKLLQSRKTFGLETTFSGNRELRVMQQAKDLGYDVKLIYVSLDNPEFNIKRVKERTENGGHFVDPATVVNRYKKSLGNLEKGIDIANKTYLIDNSSGKEYIVAKFQLGKVIDVTNKEIPVWIKNQPQIFSKIEARIKQTKLFPLQGKSKGMAR